jgi:histidinol-phosphate aminotransferase
MVKQSGFALNPEGWIQPESNKIKPMNISSLVRPNILELKPYSSARSLYTRGILMDANENPYNVFGGAVELNRYPDGSNIALRKLIAEQFNLSPECCAAGNGSDELIDLLFRIFCEPGREEVIIPSPTYGMYNVSAEINNVRIKDIPLVNGCRELDVEKIKSSVTKNTKLIFICNPNNPTAGTFRREQMLDVVANCNAIVVVDEAYADFMNDETLIPKINNYNNLVVVRTLSKAYAMAGARLGYMFAGREIIGLIQKTKPPYNINALTTSAAIIALGEKEKAKKYISEIISQREWLLQELKAVKDIYEIFPSQANFILFRIRNGDAVFAYLVEKGIIIRSRTNVPGLYDCLRVSVGTPEHNRLFINLLNKKQ